jgi:hypothetical protein
MLYIYVDGWMVFVYMWKKGGVRKKRKVENRGGGGNSNAIYITMNKYIKT